MTFLNTPSYSNQQTCREKEQQKTMKTKVTIRSFCVVWTQNKVRQFQTIPFGNYISLICLHTCMHVIEKEWEKSTFKKHTPANYLSGQLTSSILSFSMISCNLPFFVFFSSSSSLSSFSVCKFVSNSKTKHLQKATPPMLENWVSLKQIPQTNNRLESRFKGVETKS